VSTPTVADLMTESVLTVERDERPGEIATAMLDAGIKSVVVVDDDEHPVGILTSTDYVAMTAVGVDPYDTTVDEHMTRDIVTATGEESLSAVAARMREYDIAHLPVVDEANHVIGIVSSTDLTAHLADE
jgi:CBS domain-containing protein